MQNIYAKKPFWVFIAFHQLVKELLIQGSRLLLVNSCQCASENRLCSEMTQFFLLARQIGLNISQTLPAGKLRHQYGNKLIPLWSCSKFLSNMVYFASCSKSFRWWNTVFRCDKTWILLVKVFVYTHILTIWTQVFYFNQTMGQ